jgi:ferredoxin
MTDVTHHTEASAREVYLITLADSGLSFPCAQEQNVLAAMERLGRQGIPVGCRGGGCGICRVQVVAGEHYRTLKMSRAQVPDGDRALGICLACKLIPEGPLTVRALGLLRTRVS